MCLFFSSLDYALERRTSALGIQSGALPASYTEMLRNAAIEELRRSIAGWEEVVAGETAVLAEERLKAGWFGDKKVVALQKAELSAAKATLADLNAQLAALAPGGKKSSEMHDAERSGKLVSDVSCTLREGIQPWSLDGRVLRRWTCLVHCAR